MLNLRYSGPRQNYGFELMASSLTGDGVAAMGDRKATLRYYSGKIYPGFKCGANNKMPCAWAGRKVMLAFSNSKTQKKLQPYKKQSIRE
ncbi:MAG: hypothetical protein DRI65_13080 [Chloroflexota bacterium]|nr:MAG: hypothetical protein DRI65_13080 [Chloroflexota bacterium]